VWTAVSLTAISLVPPVLSGANTVTITAIIGLHLVAATVMIPPWRGASAPAPIDDRLPDGLSRSLGSDVLVNVRPPRLVLVREPDLLRVERADQPLALGARLVELSEEDRHVAADDD
jgi:hypothetical protein